MPLSMGSRLSPHVSDTPAAAEPERPRACRMRVSRFTMVETVLCMLLICLVLFGLLQLVHLFIAKEITNYAAFRAARSAAVGFNNDVSELEGKIKSIPASGRIVYPSHINDIEDLPLRFHSEKMAVIDYVELRNDVNYEYWSRSDNSYGTYYKADTASNPISVISQSTFKNYPVRFPFARAFIADGEMDITGASELANHSELYLE